MFFHKAQEKHQNEIRQKIKQFLCSYKFSVFFFLSLSLPYRHTQTEASEKLERFSSFHFTKEFKNFVVMNF